MANVSALVLIYDIRGFTAASKRMGTANLGAFATGAHKAILDLFAEVPPTFVKNLGDGHLLLWETGPQADPELISKVVAGATRARTAFTAFATGMGAAGERLPQHVGVGVALGEVSRSDDYYGVALNLAARLQNLARPEGLALDQTVFDAASSRDQALRQEFQRARVRLKGLGSTVVFVRRPFSWARLAKALTPLWVGCGLLVAWVGLADAGLGVPAGRWVRSTLDRHGFTLFRPVASEADVRAGADGLRRSLTQAMQAEVTPEGWVHAELRRTEKILSKPGEPQEVEQLDIWSSSQAICALTKAPNLSVDELRPLLRGLEATFENGRYLVVDGKAYGWTAHPDVEHTEIEPALWNVAAFASALARPGLVPADKRAAFEDDLRRAQAATLVHYPLEDGGWNIFPNQIDPALHSPYSTSLALLALLETREAGLPWDGSLTRRDALLDATLHRTVETFQAGETVPGWRRSISAIDPISPGLTLQNYALLLRAEKVMGFALPTTVQAPLVRLLTSLDTATMDAPPDAGEFGLKFVSHDGKKVSRSESINFLWHPWAIDAATRWLDRADRLGAAPDERRQVERTRAHLVIDLGAEAEKAAKATWTFLASETVYGLQGIPLP